MFAILGWLFKATAAVSLFLIIGISVFYFGVFAFAEAFNASVARDKAFETCKAAGKIDCVR